MPHLVTNQAIQAYVFLTEELGYTETQNQISNPESVDSEEPKLVVDDESKTLYQIDSAGIEVFKKNEIELKTTSLKEIKLWKE